MGIKLMLSRSSYDISADVQAAHQAKFGGYNDAPPNFQPCPAEEFWRWFSSYVIDMQEHRQFVIPDVPQARPVNIYDDATPKGKPISNVVLYFKHDDTGYGLVVNYDRALNPTPAFYKFFLCDHEWSEISGQEAQKRGLYHGGSCFHVYECAKGCGMHHAVDSSG